jgi:hypothetical protein
MLSRAYRVSNRNEFITGSSQLLWLAANLWWMTGELHDWKYRNDTAVPLLYPAHSVLCGYILRIALLILFTYYLILRPLRIMDPTLDAIERYNETGLVPRMASVFSTWREYENIHILWWLCTDYAWNTLNPSLWVFTAIPTIIISADFVVTSFWEPRLIVDHYHYLAQFLWFMANFVWAYGELYDPKNDRPYSLFSSDPDARWTCRWWSSWCLVAAYVPVVVFHVMWLWRTHKMYLESPRLDTSRTIEHFTYSPRDPPTPALGGHNYTPILPRPRVHTVPVSDTVSPASKIPLDPLVRLSALPVPVQKHSVQNYGSTSTVHDSKCIVDGV